VLIVDEAQCIPIDLLDEIRLLANIETDETKLLTVILAGQPELGTRLNQQELRQLKQRVSLRCGLRPLTLPETAAYLAGRVRLAGGIGAHLFTREAVIAMHQRSRGVPRTLSVIADNALLTAYALGQKPVSSDVIAEVCKDLDLEASVDDVRPTLVDNAPPTLTDTTAKATSASDEHRVTPTVREREETRTARVLALDSAEYDRPTEKRDPATKPERPGGMFRMFEKRRRFSIFSIFSIF
jgi:hypothetical protein